MSTKWIGLTVHSGKILGQFDGRLCYNINYVRVCAVDCAADVSGSTDVAVRSSMTKLRSRDIAELMMLCSVCQQWRSAFDIDLQRRLNALYPCELRCDVSWLCVAYRPILVCMKKAALALLFRIHRSL